MSGNFGDIQLRNLGGYLSKNFKFGAIPQYISSWTDKYAARYIHVKNARMTPFFHVAGAIILFNYMLDYKFHLKYEKHRKYH